MNTTEFHNKKTGGITFSKVVAKGRLTLDRCLRDRASSGLGAGSRGTRGSGGDAGGAAGGGGGGGRVMPGVVTRPPPVRPDADYRGMPTIAGFEKSFAITDRFVWEVGVFGRCRWFVVGRPLPRKWFDWYYYSCSAT